MCCTAIALLFLLILQKCKTKFKKWELGVQKNCRIFALRLRICYVRGRIPSSQEQLPEKANGGFCDVLESFQQKPRSVLDDFRMQCAQCCQNVSRDKLDSIQRLVQVVKPHF